MKWKVFLHVFVAIVFAVATAAHAVGELHIFNWGGDFANPELIEKFSKEFDVEVTITDYNSNETALSKIRLGGHGFDIVFPTSSHMPNWISEGLLMETRPDQMENFQNVSKMWRDPIWEPGRKYSVPWTWGSTGISVNTTIYNGDVNTAKLFLDPPEELVGKINVLPVMNDVLSMAILYVGGELCTDDKDVLKEVRDLLVSAKPKWKSINYVTKENIVSGDIAVTMNWNGYSMRARNENSSIQYGYPVHGFPLWMDNVAVLADAKNVENAKLFQNFLMVPENAAMISTFAKYANGIDGSVEFMSEELRTAPEIVIPEPYVASGVFAPACPPEVQSMYTAIWDELLE